ncbi:MAG: hypothetical protein NXI30_10765 [bacterium]|nr:hypothetical protein [bacterium]
MFMKARANEEQTVVGERTSRQPVEIGRLVVVSGPFPETLDFGKERANGGVFD